MKVFGLNLGNDFFLGAGTVLLAPVIIPVATSLLKSLTKASMKGSMFVVHQAKIYTGKTMERIGNIAAEAKLEILNEQNKLTK